MVKGGYVRDPKPRFPLVIMDDYALGYMLAPSKIAFVTLLMFASLCSCFSTPPSSCGRASRQSFRISIRRRARAILRIIPHHLATRRVSLYPIIHARERPARRVQRDRAIPEHGIRKGLIEIDGIPLAFAVCQNQRLGDELVERVRRVA